MSQPVINTNLAENDFVPPQLWGKDHWSTLAYIETKLVDGDNEGYHVQFDARMRQNRRNFRLLGDIAVSRGQSTQNGIPMSPEHGSRLADGTYLPWHDDWDCVLDMLHVGFFQGHSEDWDADFPLKLTPIGVSASAALRNHKISGGNFSNAGPVVLAMVEYTKAAA